MSLIESLVPKTKYGFRVAHQPFPVDTVLFTALVISIFDKVEAGRAPVEERRAFSYRKAPGLDATLFIPDRSYNKWIGYLQTFLFDNDKYSYVIRTDISDFYQQIYRHRLENILDSMTGETAVVRRIEQFIADWRAQQSFGLPIGTNAARLLAEAALSDTDQALASEGYEFTRYVDDFVVFVRKDQDPYAALAFLARHLSSNEGLALNNQKTRVMEWHEFMEFLGEPSAEDDATKEDSATERLFWAAYGQDGVEQEALEALMMRDLRKELEDLLAEPFWDMGRIRVVLHAMRLVRNADVANYIRANLSNLIPFAKDVCLLIEEFVTAEVPGFENMGDELVDLLLSPRMRDLDNARAWFMELGVRQVVQFSSAAVRRLAVLTGVLDTRQLHLLRWRDRDVNFFRQHKSRVSEIPAWSQPTFIFGARCLPKDEYTHWIKGTRSRLQFPLAREFSDWCLATYDTDIMR